MTSARPMVFVTGPDAMMKKPGTLLRYIAEPFASIPRAEKSVLMSEVPTRSDGTFTRT